MSTLNVGGHLSLGPKPRSTVQAAAEDGFRSLQIFASSPGAWKPPLLREAEIEDLRRARAEYRVDPLFIHAIYLINLGSADPDLVRRSRDSLIATLRAGAVMGARGVITHLGSHAGRGFPAVADQIADELQRILEESPPTVQLIMENSAGAGNIIGADLCELGSLMERAGRPQRLLLALDTAHLCAAGWNFQEPGVAERLVAAVENRVGLDRLAVIHANDALTPCGSRKDRHANIGQGSIGLEGFRALLAQSALRRVPWILETPKLEERVADRCTLEALVPEFLPSGVAHGA